MIFQPFLKKVYSATDNKVAQIADKSIKELTASDLSDATSIGKYAFYECNSLTDVTIPSNITTFDYNTFYNCSNIRNVYIPDIAFWCSRSFKDSYHPLAWTLNLYANNELITELIIPDGVTSISERAFASCDCITRVVIPSSVTNIGTNAFYDCRNLEKIEVSENNPIYCSQNGILYNKSTKTIIHVPLKISGNVTLLNDITSIGDSLFQNRTGLTSIEIPDSVTSVGSYAFKGCSSLTSVVIPDSVTTIGYQAFSNCYSLINIVIPANVTSIGGAAFQYCYKLVEVVNKSSSITITKGATSNGYAGYYALAVYNSSDTFESKISDDNGCIVYANGDDKVLVAYTGTEANLVLPSYITKIHQYTFSGNINDLNLESVTIPASVISIGANAFINTSYLQIYCEVSKSNKPSDWASAWNYAGCPVIWDCNNNEKAENGYIYTIIDGIRYALKDNIAEVARHPNNIVAVNIPKSITYNNISYNVTSVGSYAFHYCDSLTSVVIPDSVTSIGYNSFASCQNLTSVVIPHSVTNISTYAFMSCYKLMNVVINEGVQTIANYAFDTCSRLMNVTIPSSVTRIGSSSFNNVQEVTMLSRTPPTIQSTTFNSTYLKSIVVPAGCSEAYKAATNWSTYANIIEEATV